MLKHNILLFFRNIGKNKKTFFINLIGLSTGLACALMVYLWVSDEMAIDDFHVNTPYQVLRNTSNGQGDITTRLYNSDLMLSALQQDIPEMDFVTAIIDLETKALIESNEKKLKARGYMVSEDYFKVFSYPLLSGNKEQVLKDVNAVVISKSLSNSFFGEGIDPLGKTIDISHEEGIDEVFVVSGVFEIPKNASENFDFLLTYQKYLELRNPRYVHWGSNSSEVYVTLNPEVNVNALNAKIKNFIATKAENSKATIFLSPYTKKYLHSRFENGMQAGGRIDYVVLFSIIALFVLSIACINFMNLSTAIAFKKLKEVGIKKTMGASRKSLIYQYLTESILLSFFSLICAVVLVIVLLPWFSEVTGKDLTFFVGTQVIWGIVAITLCTGLIAGSYPALYLTKFKPTAILKGKINTTFAELFTRKGLVVFQFSLSILLILAVAVIYKQLDFIQSKNLGYSKDNVLVMSREGNLLNSMDAFLEEAKQIPGIINASYMQGSMTNFDNSSSSHSWPGQTEESKRLEFWHAQVGPDLIETMDIKLLEGRSYANELGNFESKIILNETAVKSMGLTDPIGTIIDMRGANREIIGVVKDFNIQSLYEDIKPMALICKTQWVNTLMIKIKAGSEKSAIEGLTSLHADFNPGLPFDFNFLDSEYQTLYISEQRVAKLSGYFAGLAILISCLGLLGLASFTAERRRKEIGIRKVLGQSVANITLMLSSEFAKLVLISAAIVLPIAYVLANNWLANFAYRIPLRFWYFLGAGLLALLIALLTVGSQAIHAAKANPIKSLKTE